jgi:putative ABC transport system permease protein
MHDLQTSLRGLLRAPVMTLTIVITVGLGIGATTAIFAAVDAALLRSLPYAAPDQLVRIYTDAPPYKFRFSLVDYLALQAQQTHFTQIAGYSDREMTFSDGTVAERVRGREVSWTYFSVLGIQPALGHDFAEPDSRPGSPPAVIVSQGFWQERLGGRADVIGRAIRLDGENYTLAGVLPHALGPLEQRQEFFVAAQWRPPVRKGPFFIIPIARLRDGASRSTAADELRAINRRLFPLWKSSYQDDRATWGMMDLQAHVVGDVRAIAGLALAAVGLVWLIACANASNLLVARITSRRRELAVRAALGASRGRVVRYLLTESGILAVAAGAVGIALAWAGIGLVRDFGVGYFPRVQEVALDGPVLWLLAALTAASTLLFGVIPALHGSGGPVDEALRAAGRSSTGSVAVRRLRRLLVASQFAISTPLLIVAGLLIGSLNELGRVDLGFDSRNLVSGAISLPATQYAEAGRVQAFWDELQRRVESLPGVASVAFADGRPPNDVADFNNFDLEEAPTPPGQSQPVTPWVAVSPAYFRVLGLPLIEGRLLNERDARSPDLEAVVVDRAWARRFFPRTSAVGKRLKSGGCSECPWTSVVGVVSEVKYAGLDKPEQGTIYRALDAAGESGTRRYLVIRGAADPATLLPAVRNAVRMLDPGLPFSNVATTEQLVARSLQRPRSLTLLVASFACVAVLLSLIGIYGVMAYYVQQHSKDISIRLALGGRPAAVLRLIVGQGMQVVSAGVAIGVLAALAFTRFASTLLFGVAADDVTTFAGVSLMLGGVALVACLVPALRAIRCEPAVVLRNE